MPLEVAQRYDFRGGVSRLRRQTQNQVLYCQNARFQGDGTIEVRKGQTKRVDISSSGNIETLYVKHSDNLGLRFYCIQRSGDPNDDCYAEDTRIIGEDLGKSVYSSIDEYKGVIFFSNGITAINYYEPVTTLGHTWGADQWGGFTWGEPSIRYEISGEPTPPKGPHILFYKDRLYVGADDGNLYWSNAGLFDTLPTVDFPALNFQQVGGLNDPVTGLVSGEDFLVAFTSGSYQIMSGAPDDDGGVGDMDWRIINNMGTRASRSISAQGKKVAFLGTNRRVYMLEGSVLTDIDPLDHVREYLTSFSNGVLRAVSSAFSGNELWWYVPIGSNEASGRVLVYNTTQENWAVFTVIDGFALYFSKSYGKLFVGRATESKVYEQELGLTDPGDALIPLEFISRQEVLGTFRKEKSYQTLNLQVDENQGETITVSYALDGSMLFTSFGVGSSIAPTGTIWGTEVWGTSIWGGIDLQNKFLHFVSGGKGVRGTEVRIKVQGNVSPGTRILSYVIEGEIELRDGEVV